jgi:uncharacterized protein
MDREISEIWAENLEASDFFDDYIQTYLERDLKQILNVSYLMDFRHLLMLSATRTGSPMHSLEASGLILANEDERGRWALNLRITYQRL